MMNDNSKDFDVDISGEIYYRDHFVQLFEQGRQTNPEALVICEVSLRVPMSAGAQYLKVMYRDLKLGEVPYDIIQTKYPQAQLDQLQPGQTWKSCFAQVYMGGEDQLWRVRLKLN